MAGGRIDQDAEGLKLSEWPLAFVNGEIKATNVCIVSTSCAGWTAAKAAGRTDRHRRRRSGGVHLLSRLRHDGHHGEEGQRYNTGGDSTIRFSFFDGIDWSALIAALDDPTTTRWTMMFLGEKVEQF